MHRKYAHSNIIASKEVFIIYAGGILGEGAKIC